MAKKATCPYCTSDVQQGGAKSQKCPECGAWHHTDCWLENGGCAVVGCTAVVKAAGGRRLIVTADDLDEDNDRTPSRGWTNDTRARLAIGAALLILIAGLFAFVIRTVTDEPERPDVEKILGESP